MRTTCALAAVLLLSACLADGSLKQSFHGYAPVARDDGWEVSTPAAENVDERRLLAAYAVFFSGSKFPGAESLIVVRNGKLVAEAYAKDDADIDRPNNLQSCTKSFTSMLAGIALAQGVLPDLEVALNDIYPENFDNDARKRGMTLHHALAMRSGLDFDNSVHTAEMFMADGASAKYVLSRPYEYEPGLVFRYNDGSPQLVSAAIQRRFKKPTDEFARQFLFGPLEIHDWYWERAKDGVTFGAFALHLRPRDFARVGVMLAQGGQWKGRRIVEKSWIDLATTPQANPSSGPSYGLYFWLYPQYQGFAAEGHGGQYLFVVPSKNLVVAYTAWPFTSSENWGNFGEIMDLLFAAAMD